MDARHVLDEGGVIDKKMVTETKYQTKRFVWVDSSTPSQPVLCWSKGTSKNEKKYKTMLLSEALAFVVGMPLKVNSGDIRKYQMDGSKCLCIIHPAKEFKGGVDLRFENKETRDLWFTTLNALTDCPEKLSLNKMLVANATVECPPSDGSLKTLFHGGEAIDVQSACSVVVVVVVCCIHRGGCSFVRFPEQTEQNFFYFLFVFPRMRSELPVHSSNMFSLACLSASHFHTICILLRS